MPRKIAAFYTLLSKLAGDESLSWHPFLADFILIGQKLEQLGFTYYKGNITLIDPEWELKNA